MKSNYNRLKIANKENKKNLLPCINLISCGNCPYLDSRCEYLHSSILKSRSLNKRKGGLQLGNDKSFYYANFICNSKGHIIPEVSNEKDYYSYKIWISFLNFFGANLYPTKRKCNIVKLEDEKNYNEDYMKDDYMKYNRMLNVFKPENTFYEWVII